MLTNYLIAQVQALAFMAVVLSPIWGLLLLAKIHDKLTEE